MLAAIAVAAAKVKTKFKKSKMAKRIGHANAAIKYANTPYMELVKIPNAAAKTANET